MSSQVFVHHPSDMPASQPATKSLQLSTLYEAKYLQLSANTGTANV